MSPFNDQYYIVFEKYNDDTLYLCTHDRSVDRDYEYTKLTSGEPMFFDNGYRQEDLARGVQRPIKQAHLDSTYPIVSEQIKNALEGIEGDEAEESIENDSFQFYPAVIVDDKGEYHDNYWVFNVFEKMDVLDLEKCSIRNFKINKKSQKIQKYCLSSKSLARIPESERLVFKPKFSNIGHIMVHESVVDVFKKHNVGTLNFVKVSDWEMGLQFVK